MESYERSAWAFMVVKWIKRYGKQSRGLKGDMLSATENNDVVTFDSMADAGRVLGVLPQNISACCRGRGNCWWI